MTEVVLEARGLRKEYGPVVAVAGLDLRVNRGEVFGFLGPSTYRPRPLTLRYVRARRRSRRRKKTSVISNSAWPRAGALPACVYRLA